MYCECPYCLKDIPDPNDKYDNEVPYEQECPFCGKTFIFHVSYSRDYHTNKAPCLNDGEHDWKPIRGYPEEFYRGKERCSYCQEERNVSGP